MRGASRSTFDWACEAFSLALLAGIFVYLAMLWPGVPDWIPTHFGFSGAPDRWGGRSQLWLIAGLALLVYAVLTAAGRYQVLLNLPFRVNRDSPEVRRLLVRMTIVLKAVTLSVFAYLVWAIVNVAKGRIDGLSPVALPIVLASALVPLILFLIPLWRLRER